jgi:hypothetical protein
MKERDSNFELCRLVCMLYIVIYHLIIHVHEVYEDTMWGRPLRTLCHIGVVVFVMISGYYGIRRKWSRLVELALSVSFYNALGLLIAVLLFGVPFEIKSLISVFFPITNGGYWFITSYVVLYLIAPYVNIVLEKLEKRDFLIYLTVLALIVCYGGGIFDCDIANGRGIIAFVLSYSLGSFIRKYYKEKTSFLTRGRRPILLYFCVFVLVFCCIAFLPTMLSKAVNYLCFGYNEIGLFIMSILFFLMFQNFKLKSKFINSIATVALGIYLFHENRNFRSLIVYPIYKSVIYDNVSNQVQLLICHVLYAVVIICACVVIDKCRQYLFNYIKSNFSLFFIKRQTI